MLQELSIRNFAIIPKLRVHFDEGMTVLTGETGAGKSIIIDAMGLLVGSRGSTSFIRQGEKKCSLEGLFYVSERPSLQQILIELGIDFEDQMLILQREILLSGKNICRVNGRLVNTATLRKIGEQLVDIHGQNEHQELMRPERHLILLDHFGGKVLSDLKSDYQNVFLEYQQIKKKVTHYQQNEKEFAQRVDMLRFQCEEIAACELKIGEEEALLEERNKLLNYQKIVESLTVSYDVLEGENQSSLDQVAQAMNTMLEIEDLDEDYKKISESIQNGYYLLKEAASDLSKSIDSLEMDEAQLSFVEDRLDKIHQVKRKYGETVASILDYYEKISKELSEAELSDDQSEQFEQQLEQKQLELVKKAQKLSEKRHEIAIDLTDKIHQQLKELYMEKAEFKVSFSELDVQKYTISGKDQIVFYISTNAGEPLKPLNKVASGGELSRIMLALKTIFSQTQGITSIVFDEVDTGVSGRVAQAIADKIHQVALNSQVLCITHLPQVAAVADAQYFIEKHEIAGRTETIIHELTEEERVAEIARMLAGSEITPLTFEHAKELLTLAKKIKQDQQKNKDYFL